MNASMTAKHVDRSRTQSPRDFPRREFHQPHAGLVDGNRIDYRAARVALDLGHIPALHNHPESVAIWFVRHEQIAAFVLHIG
jgi:hypothetical protein